MEKEKLSLSLFFSFSHKFICVLYCLTFSLWMLSGVGWMCVCISLNQRRSSVDIVVGQANDIVSVSDFYDYSIVP